MPQQFTCTSTNDPVDVDDGDLGQDPVNGGIAPSPAKHLGQRDRTDDDAGLSGPCGREHRRDPTIVASCRG